MNPPSSNQNTPLTPQLNQVPTTNPSQTQSTSTNSTPTSNKIPWISITIIAILTLLIGIGVGYLIQTNFNPLASNTQTSEAIPTPQPVDEVNEILIGGIAPLTGDASAFGVPLQQAAFIAQREINNNGGIAGKPVKIIWEDGKCEKYAAITSLDKLLDEDIQFLIAGICSSEVLATVPIAQSHDLVSFSPSATSSEISQLREYFFRTAPSDATAGKAAAEYAKNNLNAQTAAIIAENTPYTLGLSEIFAENFTLNGGQILSSQTFESNITDFTTIVQQATQNNPDIIYILPQTPTPGILIARTLKSLSPQTPILTAEVLLIRDALIQHSQILEGITGIELLFDNQSTKAQHFTDLYQEEYDTQPPYPAFMAGMYDILYLIKNAYESTGGNKPDDISTHLYQLKNWQGALGELTFNTNGDPRLMYSIKKITNGQAPQIDTYNPTSN